MEQQRIVTCEPLNDESFNGGRKRFPPIHFDRLAINLNRVAQRRALHDKCVVPIESAQEERFTARDLPIKDY